MTLHQARKHHMQQATQLMRPGCSARKAKRHFQRVEQIDLALRLRREVKGKK